MGGRLPPRLRHALLTLVVAVLALASITSLPGALGASSYVITGQVLQPGGLGPVPSGVTVQLTSSATHAIYTTTTGAEGSFTFNSANTNGTLAVGWWGLSVLPQGNLQSASCPVGPFHYCAILPATTAAQYYWESASNLTSSVTRTIQDVSVVGYTTTINATVKVAGTPVSGAIVQLISPKYPDVALAQNSTNATGITTFEAPSGSWLLYTEAEGSPSEFNYTSVTIPSSGVDHLTIAINDDYVVGSITSSTGGLVSNGYNKTLIDTSSGAYQYATFSQYSSAGYSYSVGAYPAGFTGTGVESFDLVIAPIGYTPALLDLAIPTDSATTHDVVVTPIAPPAVYNTTLNYSSGPHGSGWGLLNVTTVATLGNYSVFPDLANASVGQLWAQLALDFDHNLTLTSTAFTDDVAPWIEAQGPFFPAGQDNAVINGTGFGQPTNYTSPSPNPKITGGSASGYGLASTEGLSMGYTQVYNTTTGLPKGGTGGSYTFAFDYRHPTNSQSINYTVILPKGYVLKAGTSAPPASSLVPGGPGGTWTKFYLDSKPSSSPYSFANFTAVKYGSVSARVNVTVPTFTYSTKNVLNDSRTNYTAVVGLDENVTFSAINSTYPAGTNGSLFVWHFGDSGTNTTNQPTTHHIYTSTGKFDATLNVTSSGGLFNQISFTIYVGDQSPTANIEGNWTATENQSVSGHQYIIVNWSQSLQFNQTGSLSTLYPGAPVNGVIADAVWNLTSHNFTEILGNFSAGTGANTSTPVSYSFQGAGDFLSAGMVDGASVTPFLGWQYNLTLTVWDGQGHSANTTLVILVRDTEKPIAVVLAYNANGNLLSSAGTVEGSNDLAYVHLTGKNSTAPHNGTIASYSWVVNNTGNKSFKETNSNESWVYSFPPQQKPYTVNLTVKDVAGNTAYTDYSLTVAYNTTTRPILTLKNETETNGLTSMTAGTSYTWWFNITNDGGKLSTARNVQLLVSLTGTSASWPGGNTAGSPGSVKFYNVSANGTVGTTVLTPPIDVVYNQTVRAEFTLSPSITGTKFLWGNATCNNCYTDDLSVDHVQVTINQNETQLILEYVAIGAGAIIVIAALILLLRRRGKPAPSGSKGGGRLERGGSKDEDEDDDT